MRILRVALPIVGIAFVLLLAKTWKRGTVHPDKSGNSTVTSTIRPTDTAGMVSETFNDVQTIGGRVASRIRANRVVAFPQSGWNTLEGVSLTIYRPTGLTYELTCPQAQFNSQTKEADAKGGVHVVSSDGVRIDTAEIHFDGSHLTNHIPVAFAIDQWTGTGGALDLDVQAESLHLYEKVDATMKPADPTQSTMTLKADDGIFRRKENVVDFTKDVVLTHDADRLAADHMAAHVGADRKTLTELHGEGKVDIVLEDGSPIAGALPAKGSDTGRKEITCDRFHSELGGNGQINAIIADGDTAPAHAVIEGPPKRDLVAKSFRVGLANKIVTDVKADQQVVMKELAQPPRELTAEHVIVYFDGVSHKPTIASIDGNMHYHDPRNDARAVRANYDIAADRVILTAEPGFDPVVTTDGNIVKAKVIEFSPKAGTAKATTDVIAQLTSKQNGPSADSTNVFPANKPVFVNADQLNMRQADKYAIFTGHVRAWQEQNTIFANEMQATGAGDQITARGDVKTILYNTGNDKAPRPTPMRSRSDDLIARKNDRRIDLSGNVTLDDDQRHMQGDKASFFFDANHHIDHVEADGHIVLLEPATQRKGTGDKMTYLVTKHMIYVSGSPATMTEPTGTLTGEKIAIDTARNKVEVVSPNDKTKGTYKQPPAKP